MHFFLQPKKVFLHESTQIEFSTAVDAIMDRLKFADIEINYRKIAHDNGKMPDEGERK
jgi:hypothetical protein